MNRHRVLSLIVALVAAVVPTCARATNVWFSLNLDFNDHTNFNSGGTWKVVVKADARGLAAADLRMANVNFNPATGFLGPAGFEFQQALNQPGHIDILDGDNPGSQTIDVGVIGGPFPTSYVDPPNLVLYPGNPNLGSFSGGVELVTGSFNPGVVPAWFSAPGAMTQANSYTGTTFPGSVVLADTHLTVRYQVPEPATWLGGMCVGMLALVRRRRLA
jgi:hypothetical protein